jgi:hypothetical protein
MVIGSNLVKVSNQKLNSTFTDILKTGKPSGFSGWGDQMAYIRPPYLNFTVKMNFTVKNEFYCKK